MCSEMSQSDSDVQMTPTGFMAIMESTPTNDHLGGGDHVPSHPQTPTTTTSAMGSSSQVSLSTSNARVLFTGAHIDDHLDKLLECPVCYDLICPPIITCVRGHSCCETCREKVAKCPLCREEFSPFRNLFAEQFLEKCNFKCKFGCMACLPAQDLSSHYHDICPYRPIHCRECDRMIFYSEFLDHVQKVDKLERQRASECSTGFEIEEEDLNRYPISPRGRRNTVWEPTWMSCFGQEFFCFLDFNGTNWWIWVSSLNSGGCDFKCQIILWSKLQEAEFTYFGKIHSIRTEPDDVFLSGNCLVLTKETVSNFMYEGGIDVLVRIEHNYVIPKTRRGMEVQSPLDIMGQNPTAVKRQRAGHHSDHEQQGGQLNATPTTSAEDRRTYTRLRRYGERHESRIPISVASIPTIASYSLDPGSASTPSPQGRNLSTILAQFQDQVSGATNNDPSFLRAPSQTSSSLIANYSTESMPLTRPRRFFFEDLEAAPTREREHRGLTFTPTLTSTPTPAASESRVRRNRTNPAQNVRGRLGLTSSTMMTRSAAAAEANGRFGNEE